MTFPASTMLPSAFASTRRSPPSCWMWCKSTSGALPSAALKYVCPYRPRCRSAVLIALFRLLLQLGAGPARHSIELAKKGLRCTCVDANENMVGGHVRRTRSLRMSNVLWLLQVAYGTKIARAANVATKYVQQDMRSLELSPDTQHDFAFCLLGTFQHMLTNQDAVDCLRSAAQYLAEDGIMVIEVSHPQELFSLGDVSAEEWVRELEDGRVLSAQWGSPDDIFDPITQVRESNVAFSVETTGTEDAEMLESMVQVAFQRMFTAQEMDALARASGVFTVVDMYGDMESKVDIGDVDNAFRMVVVLKKRAPAEIASDASEPMLCASSPSPGNWSRRSITALLAAMAVCGLNVHSRRASSSFCCSLLTACRIA
eukprot:scaffold668_cov385-Prasinococcus_capsulatus_cf.AAC.23